MRKRTNKSVRQDKSGVTRDTHPLLSAEGGESQDNKGRPASEGHLPTVERRDRHELEQQKKSSELGSLTSCSTQIEEHLST
jgi:hypothetical protein